MALKVFFVEVPPVVRRPRAPVFQRAMLCFYIPILTFSERLQNAVADGK